jgi:hypothetical protein
MQFIEKNSFNVRSAVYRLKKPNDNLEFVLFPMIHIGSKQFYDEVRQQLLNCDLILAEGVMSKKVALLTLSYRVIRNIKRIDLVTQQEALKISDLSERIINSDMGGKSFDNRWAELPVMFRIQLLFGLPIYIIYLFLFGTRDLIAENIAIDDLASRDEILNFDEEFEKYDRLIVDERDQVLIRNIDHLYGTRGKEKKVVGIVYGAMHMRNITLHLSEKLGYSITGSEWITVFDL